MNDYDETTAFLGDWGRFQQIVFFLLCVSTIPNGTGVLSIIFVAAIPSHHCMIPDLNLTQEWRNAVIPVTVVDGKEELSKCSRYKLDVVRNLSAQGLIPGRDLNLTDLEQESCLDGWSYSKDLYQSTIVSEFFSSILHKILGIVTALCFLDAWLSQFDLVCSEQWKQPFTSTVYFLGVLVGSFFSGQLADRYGRKPVFFITVAAQTIFTFLQVFSPSWTVFIILSFFSGLGQISNYISALVLGAEIFTGHVRVLYTSLGVCLFYALGYMILPLIAYLLRDWKSLMLAVALPCLLYIPLWWFIPESSRWLLSQGRVEEAEAIVRDAAKQNKVKAPQVIFKRFDADEKKTRSEKEEHHTVFDLIRTSNIRLTTIIFSILFFTFVTGYYGLSLNSAQLSADPYISCFISGAVELPGYISCWLALRYLPRRPFLSFTALLGGVSLFFIQLVPPTLSEVSVTLEMLGKYAFTTSSTLLYTYVAELYPTVLRSTASGTCGTFSRFGICISPFLFQLRVYFKYLPYIILGSLAVVSAFAIVFLPESFGKPMPETIDQMHKRERLKFPCITRKAKPEPAMFLESQL